MAVYIQDMLVRDNVQGLLQRVRLRTNVGGLGFWTTFLVGLVVLVGSGLSILAVTEHTMASAILRIIVMTITGAWIATLFLVVRYVAYMFGI